MKTLITFLFAFFLFAPTNLFSQENRLNKNGEKAGKWIEYHKNGKLSATGVYENGQRKGKWKEYYGWNGHLKCKLKV